VVGEKYDCTMIFSLVWMENSTPNGQTANHRAHYLFWGYDYYMTTMIFFIGLDKPLGTRMESLSRVMLRFCD
jgi:hypothetical protein